MLSAHICCNKMKKRANREDGRWGGSSPQGRRGDREADRADSRADREEPRSVGGEEAARVDGWAAGESLGLLGERRQLGRTVAGGSSSGRRGSCGDSRTWGWQQPESIGGRRRVGRPWRSESGRPRSGAAGGGGSRMAEELGRRSGAAWQRHGVEGAAESSLCLIEMRGVGGRRRGRPDLK